MREYNTKKTNDWNKTGVKPKDIPKEKFIEICRSSESMAHACSILGLHFNTFRNYAIKYNCYIPNQSGKGIKKNIPKQKSLEQLQSFERKITSSFRGLKQRLIENNILDYHCLMCGISEWKGKFLSLHLDHIDGNRNNNNIDNLRLLCPNCHSQTPTYCRKKNK